MFVPSSMHTSCADISAGVNAGITSFTILLESRCLQQCLRPASSSKAELLPLAAVLPFTPF